MPERSYDAIVVGSGAAGGWAAKELAERGLTTLVLEAGPPLDPVTHFPPPAPGKTSKLQVIERGRAILGGQHIQARCMSFSPSTRQLFVNDRENPYSTPGGQPFNWYRSRQVGGRTHLWGRNAVRIGDDQLHASRSDGYGPDWPISYADLAPWYERVERFLGVHGTAAGIPQLPDGVYDRPLPITRAEERVLSSWNTAFPDRRGTTARIVRHNPDRFPLTLRAGLATGRLDVQSHAAVSRIIVDPRTGLASGVAWVDRRTRAEVEVQARIVMVCASTIETLRILLNSSSPTHPQGLGNSSGTLGRGLTDHVMVFQAGPHEPLEPVERTDFYDFGSQSGIYIPSFRNVAGQAAAGFLRGYSLLGSVGRISPGWFFMAVGEMLARDDNRVTLDPHRTDAWGIPVARIQCTHGDNERAMVKDMQAALRELAGACGLAIDVTGQENFFNRTVYRLVSRLVYTPEGALVPGSAIHESGGAAMGSARTTSVLNPTCQLWDAPNVFVTDSAAFPTSPFQNPGLTIMALSARAANHAADELTRRNL